jgi:tetratricopeptide (TPR) repeat protein
MNKTWLVLGTVVSISAHAQSGADALLQSLGGGSNNSVMNVNGKQATAIQTAIHLDNPVARQLFTEWSVQKNLSYEANLWVQKFFAGEFEAFAHLKTAMIPAVEETHSLTFQNAVEAAHLYSLYRLNLAQTFMGSWLKAMDHDSFATSQSAFSLDEAMTDLDQWLVTKKIQISPAQDALIRKIGYARHPNWLSMNAFVLQRRGLQAEEVLSKLSVNSVFRPKLAMTVALAHARKGDLANAAKTLKIYYEPWMNQANDATASSRYSLEIARMLYQIGSIDGAIQFYQKIPKGSPDYVTAREELSWCWLRQGNLSELRGNLTTLNSSLLNDQFRPETVLVKSISDLKMCHYQDVEKGLQLFIKQNKEWAKKIDASIQSTEPPMPRIIDDHSRFSLDALALQSAELHDLEALSNRSVSAVFPAVGRQKHWDEQIQNIKLVMETTKKRQAEEFRRQWKSDRTILQESIRKMQFVKVELLSQVGQMESLTKKDSNSTDRLNAAKNELNEKNEMSFPYDGVVWPDEVFKLKAVANGQCAEKL